MIRKLGVMFMISGIFLVAILMRKASAVGYNDCFKEKNDSKIRIGFLSRYISSKVSSDKKLKFAKNQQMFVNWILKHSK